MFFIKKKPKLPLFILLEKAGFRRPSIVVGGVTLAYGDSEDIIFFEGEEIKRNNNY